MKYVAMLACKLCIEMDYMYDGVCVCVNLV